VSAARRAPRTLSLALGELTATLAPASTLARVQGCWGTAAGEAIAAAAAPVAERGGVLTVRCESAVWAAELALLENDLLDRLNGALGERLLHKLRCRAG
jgi:predicted nucleic acid-binding Zn ribbon protein